MSTDPDQLRKWREGTQRYKERHPERSREIQRRSAAASRAAVAGLSLAEKLAGAEGKFWRRVEKGRQGECWDWIGALFKKTGYGAFSPVRGAMLRANRASYFYAHAVDPEDYVVCHRCDNPRCVNPEHLFLGTHKDNTQDMITKGRAPDRAKKLTVDQVRAIFVDPRLHKEIASDYGVARPTVSYIKRRKVWCSATVDL